jgi:hypothetical protein
MIELGMIKNQLQRSQIMPLFKQSRCQRAPIRMTAAALDARDPV